MYSSLKEATALLERDEWVKPYLGRCRKILALALVLGCCTVLFAAGLMFTSGWLIAGSAEMPYSVLMLGTPLLCVRVFGVGKPILRYCERLASHNWVLRFTSNLRKQLYRSFDAEGVFFHASHRLGDALLADVDDGGEAVGQPPELGTLFTGQFHVVSPILSGIPPGPWPGGRSCFFLRG